MFRSALVLTVSLLLSAATVFAKQGAVRALYTVPNTTFIEQPAGDSVVTINDTSGSISSVQAAIDNARSANPSSVIVIHLLRGAVYSVSSAGLVLGSHECLVAEGSILQAADASVTVPLITIASGSTNVSVAGGTLDGQNANIQGIFAPSAARVNIDKVVLKNFGSDAISLNGNGNTTFDNEMTVTRTDVSTSASGIHIQNSTQTTVLDNNCHDNGTGILVSAAWANIANNTCHNNTIGIDIAGGSDNVVANNTCNNNGTGIHAGAANGMIVSNALGNNTTAGIASDGTSNNFIDNLFTDGNAANFLSGGASNNIIAYKSPVSASGQNYFYPPLVDNQHTDITIVNGMGRTDLTIASATIDNVQSQYNAALSANPGNVIVLHLNGTFTVGANPLKLSSNTVVLLNGTIQINSSTTAKSAISTSASGQTRISISGGVVDGGGRTGNNGINISNASMLQIDNMTLRNFGSPNPRVGGSDVIHLSGGSTPYIVTRNTINGGAARGIWLQLSRQKSLISDNEVTNVNQDGVDCDSSTFGSVVKFNYCHDLVRYGVFFEQSAKNNLALGNICNKDGRDINVFNNDTNPRAATQFNSIISNSLLGSNGIRNGSTGNTATVTSHNFFFDNTVINASIESQLDGTQNYYSQNYLSGGTLSTSGSETFFNSADVSGNLQIRDSNSGLAVVVQNASTVDGAAIVTAQPNPMGDGSNDDEWQFIPTNNGYYRITNTNSGLVMAVQNAFTANDTPVIQSAYTADSTFNDEWLIQPTDNGLYNFVNRLSGLYLDVPGASTTPGTQLDQLSSNGGANQQFSLLADVPAVTTTTLASAENPSTFGQPVVFVATVSSALATGTVQFLDNGSALSTPVALSNGAATFTTAVLTAGTHNISAVYSGDASYLGSTSTVLQQIVNQATPLITWGTPAPITYGTALSAAQLNATANTSGTFVYSPAAGTIFNAGTQTLTVTFTPDDTADFTTASTTVSLTVNPAPLTVTAADATRQYGQANPSFTGAIVGLQNGDNITATYSSSADPTSPVGTYAIVPALADPDGKLVNYTVTSNNGTLTVTPAPLVATANNQSRVYGQPNPPFAGTLVGVLNNDAISLSFTTSATPASPVGSYAIVPVLLDPTGKLGNYAVTVNNGVLAITPATLVIAANNQSRLLDAPNPPFTVTYSGFVLGQGPEVLSGALLCTTTALTNSPVGTYPITCSGLSSTNYSISYLPGVLSIVFAPSGPCYGEPGHVILPPIAADGSSLFNAHRTVPAKFRVCDASGVSIGAPGTVSSFNIIEIITATGTQTVNLPVPSRTPDSAFRWDPVAQQWIFNINASALSAGATYVFRIGLADSSEIVFQFGLR